VTTTAGGWPAYRFGQAVLAVDAGDEATLRWLRESTSPWFTTVAASEPDARVRMVASADQFAALAARQAQSAVRPIACFSLASALVSYPGWSEPDGASVIADSEYGCYYRVLGRQVDIVARPHDPLLRVGLLRVLRELATLKTLAAPRMLDLHAAACVYRGLAILLVGGKRAGKTTLLAHVLSSGQASLLANDRLLLDVGSAEAFGVPMLVPVREETERRFPALGRGLPRRAGLLHAGELAAVAATPADASARLVLSPSQFAGQLGAATVASAKVGVVVVPELSPNEAVWSLQPLARDEGVLQLCRAIHGSRPEPREPTVFESVVGSAPDPATQAMCVQQLADTVPLVSCRLGPDACRGQPRVWLRALPLAKGDAGAA
jgi:hypothetical protein